MRRNKLILRLDRDSEGPEYGNAARRVLQKSGAIESELPSSRSYTTNGYVSPFQIARQTVIKIRP